MHRAQQRWRRQSGLRIMRVRDFKRLKALGPFVVAWLFICAGLLKLSDLVAFGEAVACWRIVPASLRSLIVVGVPAVELACGMAFVLGLCRRVQSWAMMAALVVFTLAFLIEAAGGGGNGRCGCFGALAAHVGQIDDARWAVGRNLVLITMLMCGARRPPLVGSSRTERAGEPRVGAPRAEPGMTLIETILVVAPIGVLVALTAPVLRGVSEAGRAAGTLSNLRQHGAIMAVYGADQRDAVPCVTNPRATQSIIRCRAAGVTLTVGYFSGAKFWYVGLADAYYDGALYSPSFRSPLATSAAVGWYIMPCSYLADPEYYNPHTRREPPLQFRGTAFPEVVWPAKKSLVVDIAESARAGQYGPRMASAAMADGHAVRLRATDPLPQYPNGDGAIHPQFAPDWPAIEPMTHTLDGVRGRDLP